MGVKKETQKEKIEILEKELERKEELIKSLVEQIKSQNKVLESNEKIIDSQKQYIDLIEIKLKNPFVKEKKHNERGAGRKQSFTEEEKGSIEMYRVQGKTIREIAELFKCSTRTINRVLAERKGSNENMKNKEYGWLGYNNNNDKYGILNKMDLWEDDGLHCGECLDIVIDGKIVHTRIEMKGKTWYLVDTGLEGNQLEGIKVVIK